MIGQFVAAERATLRRKSVFPIAAREPITPNDPESAKGLHDQAKVVERVVARPPESAPQAVNPAPGSLGLDPIAELQRNAVLGGKGASEQAEVVVTGHGQIPLLPNRQSVGARPCRFNSGAWLPTEPWHSYARFVGKSLKEPAILRHMKIEKPDAPSIFVFEGIDPT